MFEDAADEGCNPLNESKVTDVAHSFVFSGGGIEPKLQEALTLQLGSLSQSPGNSHVLRLVLHLTFPSSIWIPLYQLCYYSLGPYIFCQSTLLMVFSPQPVYGGLTSRLISV